MNPIYPHLLGIIGQCPVSRPEICPRSGWQEPETLLLEMGIESKNCIDPSLAHDLEACTIYQRELPTVRCQQGAHPLPVNGLIHPADFYQGQNIALGQPHGFDPKAMLKKRRSFDQNVIAADQTCITAA